MTIQGFGAANVRDILDLQTDFSIALPKEYISFLQTYNGGIVEKNDRNKVFVRDLSSTISVDVLYGLKTESSASDIRTWMDKFQDELVNGAIIIGDDLMHGLIVMICDGEDSGIYYWDDSYQFEESSDEENTYWIADNFQSFIQQLL